MKNRALLDSSFLFALHNRSDVHHQAAQKFSLTFRGDVVIPDVTLPEVAFLFSRRGGTPVVARFLRVLAAAQPSLEPISAVDILRAAEIMEKYRNAEFDFVDCCIMTLAERLNITQVCTFDRRDFTIFRPSHCAHLELLP